MELTRSVEELFLDNGMLQRRRAPRRTPDAAVRCTIRDPRSTETLPAGIRDISLTGIALFVADPFDDGQLLTIELWHDGYGLTRKYLVEVRHADICCPNDSWLHGCRFARPLHADDLSAWL